MNTLAIVVIVIALIMSSVAAWGYNSAKDDEQKKKVYMGVGVFGLILGIGGIVIMMMGGEQPPQSFDDTLPNNPKNLIAMARNLNSKSDAVKAKLDKMRVAKEANLRDLEY